MPRLARLDAPGVLHHVIGRGIERRKIFLKRFYRNDFIARLAQLTEDGSMAVYGCVCLGIAAESFPPALQDQKAAIIIEYARKLLTGYVVNFN